MIKKTLADKTRALYLKCGDRDDFRIFNANLEKYKYMSFYPYFDGAKMTKYCTLHLQ